MCMKILITGSTGFIGRNVKEYFEAKGYDITAPSSRQLDCIDEVAVKKYLTGTYYDYIFHFAVYGDGIDRSKDGTKSLEYNLRMFHNFAKYSSCYGKMLYTGSGAEYDKRFPIHMVEETEIGKSIPTDQYGLMKYTVNQLIEHSENIYNLRLFGIFGPYEFWKTKYISNLCCKAIKGIPLSMRKNCVFDYLWIDDFCRMLEKFILIEKPKFHAYNAVSGSPVELYRLAKIVRKISEKDLKIIVCKDGYANEYTASNVRMMQELGDFSYTNIENSVEMLYRWYEKRQDDIDIYSLIYG